MILDDLFMHRALRMAFFLTFLLWTMPLAGQQGAELGGTQEKRFLIPLKILARQMPRLQLGTLDGMGPPSLALVAQAERLLLVPKGETGVHGFWSSVSLDPEDRAAARPRGEIEPPDVDSDGAIPDRLPWISGAHFDATVFSDALLVEGLAGTASVQAGGEADDPSESRTVCSEATSARQRTSREEKSRLVSCARCGCATCFPLERM